MINPGSTAEEMQQWLIDRNFSDSAAALSGLDGGQILGMTAPFFQALVPQQGTAIYAALHPGITWWCGGDGSMVYPRTESQVDGVS